MRHRLNYHAIPGPGDFDPPEDEDGPECPECCAEMEEGMNRGTFRCTSEECGHEMDDPRVAADEARAEDMAADAAWERRHG